MEKYRVTNGDIEMLVYEKSFRLKDHHQTVWVGRSIPREDAVKYAAMLMDIKRSGANESPDTMFKRTNTLWAVADDRLIQENIDLQDTINDLEQEIETLKQEKEYVFRT